MDSGSCPGSRESALNGELAFGTIDTFLYGVSLQASHKTDATNASRTSFDIRKQLTGTLSSLELFNAFSSLLLM